MRIFVFLMILGVTPVFAQGVDWDKIGRPLGEDSVDVYDRYVYFDETKISAPNVPVVNPLISLQEVEQWMMEQTSFALNFNWQNAKQHFIDVKPFFTDRGLRDFFDFLAEVKAVEHVTENAADLTTVVSFTPDILANSVVENVYRWNADVPLIMTYQSPQGSQTQELKINIDVVRVPLDQSEDGIAIDHWEVKQAKIQEQKTIELSKDLEEIQEISIDESASPAYQ